MEIALSKAKENYAAINIILVCAVHIALKCIDRFCIQVI